MSRATTKREARTAAAAVPVPVLVTPEELAARYAVAKSTVLDWFHQGKISAEVAVGKVYRFDAEKVAADLRAEAEGKRGARGERMPKGAVPVI